MPPWMVRARFTAGQRRGQRGLRTVLGADLVLGHNAPRHSLDDLELASVDRVMPASGNPASQYAAARLCTHIASLTLRTKRRHAERTLVVACMLVEGARIDSKVRRSAGTAVWRHRRRGGIGEESALATFLHGPPSPEMPPTLRGTTSKYFSGAKAGAGPDAAPQRVPDYIVPSLHGAFAPVRLFSRPVLFCGINPGAESGAQRHHYAHRSNVSGTHTAQSLTDSIFIPVCTARD